MGKFVVSHTLLPGGYGEGITRTVIQVHQVTKSPNAQPKLFTYEEQMKNDHLCGLVVRVPGYKSKGPGFDSLRYQIF
jgi:hypothetical protein